MKTCIKCNCDCHCNEELHVPTDTLDTGGACTCDLCDCSTEDGIPHWEEIA